MHRARWKRYGVAVVLAVVGAAAPARAQPVAAQAESLFREGRELLAAGKTAEACDAFEQSQKLDPATATLLNLAGCLEQKGQIATAWGLFIDAERQTRAATDDATKAMHDIAQARAAKLEPRVSKLTVSVSAESRVDGLEIQRGGELIDRALWNRALPIDGGTYTVTARAPGMPPWTTTVTVSPERDVKTVDVPKLVAGLAGKSLAASGDDDEDRPGSSHRYPYTLPIATGAVSVALLGTALGFELWSRSTYSQSTSATDPTQQTNLWHRANDQQYAAAGLAAAGVVGTGVTVWLYLRARHHDDARTAVVPFAGGDRAGLAVIGRF